MQALSRSWTSIGQSRIRLHQLYCSFVLIRIRLYFVHSRTSSLHFLSVPFLLLRASTYKLPVCSTLVSIGVAGVKDECEVMVEQEEDVCVCVLT